MTRWLTVGLLLASAPIPLGAAPARPQASQSTNRAREDAFGAIFMSIVHQDYDAAERQLSVLERGMPDTNGAHAVALNFEALIAAGRGRESEASAKLVQSEKLLPDQADLAVANYYGLLTSGRLKLAGAYLDHMIAKYPDKVRELEQHAVSPLLRDNTSEPVKTIEDRKIALAQLGFGGLDGDYLAEAAAGLLLARGDQAGAAALARDIDNPSLIEDMLIQRRYASLWPTLEQQAGPHMERSRASLVRKAEAKVAEAPEDRAAFAHLVNAYRKARRYDRLDEIRKSLPNTPAELAKAEEQTGWAINNLAYAEFERGRPEQADKLFADLTSAVTDSWRISMMINRIELLVSGNAFARALPLIAEAEKVDQSPYARQLLRRLRYCSLVRLGRSAEAVTMRPDLLAHVKDAAGPTADGLACAGEFDAAEQVALSLADKPENQADLVRALQPAPLTSDDPSEWRRWQAMRSRPALAALYARLGRDLPPGLLADASSR